MKRGKSVPPSTLGMTPSGLEYLRLQGAAAPTLVYFPGLIDATFSPKELIKRRQRLFGPWAASRTVYLLSRRRPIPEGWAMEQMAADYAQAVGWIIEQEGVVEGRIDIAGASFGGCVAMQFALDHPHLVRRLVLQQCAARGDPAKQEEARRWMAQLDRGEYLAFARAVVHQSYPQRPRWFNDVLACTTWPAVRVHLRRRCTDLARSLRAIDGYDVMERLRTVRTPTLVMAGALDELVPLTLARETARQLSHAQLHVFERGSHSVQVEHTQNYARVLADFLDSAAPLCAAATGTRVA
ncbi:MAG: alpha/beta hydrolase [Pseudomonadota bacterium]